MRKCNRIAAGLAFALASSPLLAAELVAVQMAGKDGSTRVGMDFVASGRASSLEFELILPSGVKHVDLAKCAKAVPSTHTATCDFRDKEGKVLVILISYDGSLLPEGGLDLGEIRYTSPDRHKSAVRVEGLVVGNDLGQAVPSSVHLNASK